MTRLFLLALSLISFTSFSQDNPKPSDSGLVTLEQFVATLKSKNESIKNAESINVMVNDLLIENWADYTIDPSNIARMEILALEPKEASQHKTTPSIIITTKRK